jgi:hypothetical protein
VTAANYPTPVFVASFIQCSIACPERYPVLLRNSSFFGQSGDENEYPVPIFKQLHTHKLAYEVVKYQRNET